MLRPNESRAGGHRSPASSRPAAPAAPRSKTIQRLREGVDDDNLDDDESPVEWTDEDIVFLHWRLLREVSDLAVPTTPLETKLDTLRWVFTDRDKDSLPFSFASCLRVVGCSPLSPIEYCGRVDVEEVRDLIRHSAGAWLTSTLERYPAWVRAAFARNPEWIEARLAANPQWINEQTKKQSLQDDLFV